MVMYFRTSVPNLFGTRDPFRGRRFLHGGGAAAGAVDGSGGNASNGERQVKLRSLSRPRARLPLTSCCAARFLTGRAAQGLGPLF